MNTLVKTMTNEEMLDYEPVEPTEYDLYTTKLAEETEKRFKKLRDWLDGQKSRPDYETLQEFVSFLAGIEEINTMLYYDDYVVYEAAVFDLSMDILEKITCDDGIRTTEDTSFCCIQGVSVFMNGKPLFIVSGCKDNEDEVHRAAVFDLDNIVFTDEPKKEYDIDGKEVVTFSFTMGYMIYSVSLTINNVM